MPWTTRKRGRKTAAPPGTAPKVARKDKPLVYIKRKEMERREEAVAEREAAVAAQQAAVAEEKAALATQQAALAEKKAEVKVRIKTIERAEARHAAEKPAAKTAQENADRTRPMQDLEAQSAQARKDLKPRKGALLNESQSRTILLLNFHLVQEGDSPNAALHKTAYTVRVGVEKVLKIRTHWFEEKELLTTSGYGRGTMRGVGDKRKVLDEKQCAELNGFISSMHEKGQQLFRRTVGEWIEEKYNRPMSNRAVGGLLYRLGYRRRRGRIKISPMNEARKARIRRFLVEIVDAIEQEDDKRAILVYMDESFVHQLHGSAYSYFFTDKKGVVQDGMGRTSGKGHRMIMVHAITKHGPLVTHGTDHFPIPEGPFTPKAHGRGRVGAREMGSLPTAECLWQAKNGKRDYHDAMTDKMFMDWLEKHLTPAFKEVFGDDKITLVLDNASYHHGFDEEVKVPETNSKKYNTGLLQKYGVASIKVGRTKKKNSGGPVTTTRNIEVREPGDLIPQANSECGNGVSKEEVALATRAYFQVHHPEKLLKKVERYMQMQGWELIWTPPYMPSFQPIELFWQHGKQYVSFRFDTKRRIDGIWEQIRKGWYGDPEWNGQEGGWKAANCGNLVKHAIKEMDKWIENDIVLGGSVRNLKTPIGYDKDAVDDKVVLENEGVAAQIELEMAEECPDFFTGEGGDDNAEV